MSARDLLMLLQTAESAGLKRFLYHHHGNLSAREWAVISRFLKDPFGEDRFDRAESRPGAAGFAVGMPNFPAIYAVHAGLSYIREIGVPTIAGAADPLIEECIEELVKLPVELLTPVDKDSRAGIISFRHRDMERIALACKRNRLHVMAQAGRIRIAIHSYNSRDDVGQVLRSVYEGL